MPFSTIEGYPMPTERPSASSKPPLVEILDLELSPPSLEDNRGDIDRLVAKIEAEGYTPVDVDPARLDHFSSRLRQSRYRPAVVIGRTRDRWEMIELFPSSKEGPALAFAVDLGTSRLTFYLVDLSTGETLARSSVPNPQIRHGEDVLTRILFARDVAGRETLKRLLVEAFNDTMAAMLRQAGADPQSVYAVTVAGNTVMSHTLLGLDPSSICREPYIPVANRFPFLHARDLGLSAHPGAPVYVFPNVGSYFGGDLIAGILAAGLHNSEATRMLIDVGTNAEIVLGNRDWIIACAGAAGPALEGGVVERGMMAGPGAVDRVRIDPETLTVDYRVLGDIPPTGICGSGLIDLIAEMFMAGILTIQGKLNRRLECPRIVKTGDGYAFVLVTAGESADGLDLAVSEIDIGILLKSKAAMYTILTIITGKVGVDFPEIDTVFIAGTFGNHIDPRMAVTIGMLPDLPLEKYRGLGNTAGKGAAMLLSNRDLLAEIERICDKITYIELNVNMELMNEFRGALFLPHTDPRLFPSVKIPERARGVD